jgi:hypothetical protein
MGLGLNGWCKWGGDEIEKKTHKKNQKKNIVRVG